MPKIPYKPEKSRNDDEDYEIVSFEDFCDKSPNNAKKDLLTLNDNINYRLYYEGDGLSQFIDKEVDLGNREAEELKETSLSGSKAPSWKKSVSGREPKYQRFSHPNNVRSRIVSHIPGPGSGVLLIAIVCILAVGVWWAVGGALGGAWGEEHYKRLRAKVHPEQNDFAERKYIIENIINNIDTTQMFSECSATWPHLAEHSLPRRTLHPREIRYHDHNNLSTKNKNHAGGDSKKKIEPNKKSSTYAERPLPGLNNLCSQVKENMKFDCYPQPGANEEGCLQRENRHGISTYYEKKRASGYPDDFEIAKIDFKYLSNDVLQVKIYDGVNKRFEPPYPEIPMVLGPINNLKYRVIVESTKIGFKIVRNSDNITILDSQNVGGLVLSDKFLQFSALLPTNKLYGLGERRSRFQLNTDWQQYTIFNFDTAPQENDVQWNDLDYMNNSNDFTYDHVKYADLPHFVDKLHEAGMHYIPLIDPGVSASEPRGQYPPYDRGLELEIFIKNSTGLPFVGKVWNKGSTVWPDFTHPSSMSYWVEMLSEMHHLLPYDGAWIDMNEPSNFLSGPMYGSCEPENFPYMPHVSGGEGLKSKTLCMDAIHYVGKHFDCHSLYSLTEAIATNFALMEVRGKRPFIISRSTFVGSGRYAGHWSGDIASDWHDMEMSIPELLAFSLFGIPMMGADICGFRGDTTPELCKRWMQLGAFYPFSRNHNSDTSKPQDPVSLGEEVVEASREALRLRYALLPYLYTLFHRAHVYGETVARPMFFEFPSDTATHAIDTQFMLGPSVLIVPILKPGQTEVSAYLPINESWYNFRDGRIINIKQNLTENSTVLIRGGAILALQTPPVTGPVTTTVSRSAPLQLLATGGDGVAHGQLYWDDGDSINSYEEKKFSHIEFKMVNDTLTSLVLWWGYGVPPVNMIIITSVRYSVKSVVINNKPCSKSCSFTHDSSRQVLIIHNLILALDKPFTMSWSYKHPQKLYTPKNNKLGVANNTVACKNSDCSN
ncbi:Lysosomal alpha-glucosidase [Eumeta japonica]|uniref:Lysosomal alpha-glucosidase n=1 Tax=Eumeta variegata TaxID=151549 RepID=A0A4C1V398_EUMVA|nr:Lysosomal alpha-glucosidase [Eumeta japonica]